METLLRSSKQIGLTIEKRIVKEQEWRVEAIARAMLIGRQ